MKVKVYSQKNCKYCDNIKEELKKNKVEFESLYANIQYPPES